MKSMRLVVPAAALLCLALGVRQGLLSIAASQANRYILSVRAGGAASTAAPTLRPNSPELQFAAAYAANQRGSTQEALNGYRQLQAAAGARLRHDAMYNSGNIYLQRTLEARGRDPGAASTLAELAKTSYRELLREDSSDWDARYNLEKTLRLAPDPEAEEESFGTPPSRLQKAPTGPGTSLGLP